MWWPLKSDHRHPAPPTPTINALPLPLDLITLIEAGRWRPPANLSGVDRLFPDCVELNLYSLDYMPFENRGWIKMTEPIFLGTADPDHPPGDIDPERSLLIGDLGFGTEQPIALDYRESADGPRILTLLD